MDPSELSGLPKLIWNGLIGELGYADNPTVFAVCAVLCVVVPYLLGSINFAVIFSRRMYADDVRDHGSGNAGSTNMLRTYGVKSALLTFAGDFTKSFVATAMGLLIMPWYTGFAFISGFMCLLGHAFPVFFGFRGGKCVASLAGVVLVINPPAWIFLMLVFVLAVALSGYVSPGSIIGAVLIPVCNSIMPFWFSPPPPASIICTILMAALVVFLHRKNIQRLIAGEESKFSFKKKKEQ